MSCTLPPLKESMERSSEQLRIENAPTLIMRHLFRRANPLKAAEKRQLKILPRHDNERKAIWRPGSWSFVGKAAVIATTLLRCWVSFLLLSFVFVLTWRTSRYRWWNGAFCLSGLGFIKRLLLEIRNIFWQSNSCQLSNSTFFDSWNSQETRQQQAFRNKYLSELN